MKIEIPTNKQIKSMVKIEIYKQLALCYAELDKFRERVNLMSEEIRLLNNKIYSK